MDIQGDIVQEGRGEEVTVRVWTDSKGYLVLHRCNVAETDEDWLSCPLHPQPTSANGPGHTERHRVAQCWSITPGDRPPLPPTEVERRMQKHQALSAPKDDATP